jgi:hypothetical protein
MSKYKTNASLPPERTWNVSSPGMPIDRRVKSPMTARKANNFGNNGSSMVPRRKLVHKSKNIKEKKQQESITKSEITETRNERRNLRQRKKINNQMKTFIFII